MPIGPSCCGRRRQGGSRDDLEQHAERLQPRHRPARTCSRRSRPNQIHVLFYEGSGSFGNGCVAFDTAESAAIMSKAVGAPVRLQMMRWDEHGWTHYAPAIMYDMRAGVDANGNIVAYEATGFGQGGTSIYTGRELLGSGPGSPSATANALPSKVNGAGAVTENLSPWMKVSGTNYKVINKPIDSTMGIFHSGPLRAPGAQQTTLADAQTMQMLAVAAGMDDLAFRLQNMNTDLDGQRWAAVLQAAATAAGWKPWVPGSKVSKDNVVTGRGIANSHHGGAYAAAVADVQVNKKTGKITVTHIVRVPGFRVLDEPEPDLQPDDRERDPGREPCAERGGDLQQEPGHLDRLDRLPDPAVQGRAEGDAWCSSRGRISRRSGRASRPRARSSARSPTRSTMRPACACTRRRSRRAASARR